MRRNGAKNLVLFPLRRRCASEVGDGDLSQRARLRVHLPHRGEGVAALREDRRFCDHRPGRERSLHAHVTRHAGHTHDLVFGREQREQLSEQHRLEVVPVRAAHRHHVVRHHVEPVAREHGALRRDPLGFLHELEPPLVVHRDVLAALPPAMAVAEGVFPDLLGLRILALQELVGDEVARQIVTRELGSREHQLLCDRLEFRLRQRGPDHLERLGGGCAAGVLAFLGMADPRRDHHHRVGAAVSVLD